MELRQLAVFCKIAETGSFTKAGEALNLSQPAVSAQVRSLEEELGSRLFDRARSQKVTLTDAGQVLYHHARDLLHSTEEALRAVRELQGLVRGQIVVGASSLAGEYLLPPLLVKFHQDYPGIELTLKVADTNSICGLVRRGEVELGIVGAEVVARELVFQSLVDDEMVLIVHPDHPWASQREASVADLKEETLLLPEATSGIRIVLVERLKHLGMPLRSISKTIELGTTEAIKAGVEHGLGVAVVPRRAVGKELNAGLVVPLIVQGLDLKRPLFLVTHKHRTASAASKAFIDCLWAEFGDKQA